MFRSRLFRIIKTISIVQNKKGSIKIRNFAPIALGFISTVKCEDKQKEFDISCEADSLEHEFLIKQATTVSVNAATQLLTVTLVAIQDTSER